MGLTTVNCNSCIFSTGIKAAGMHGLNKPLYQTFTGKKTVSSKMLLKLDRRCDDRAKKMCQWVVIPLDQSLIIYLNGLLNFFLTLTSFLTCSLHSVF